ncbi:MAG: PDC sensor domain-containing protein [Desulfomonilia bacterium]
MDQEAKTNFSFASIAISFFILIVLPLTITGVIISKGVVKVGEEATQANLRILDDSQKLLIAGRAQNVADAVAQFLSDREKDIRIASILPRDEKSYTTFLRSNTRGVVKASNVGIVKIPVPMYREIAFLDKDGKEVLRVVEDGAVPLSEFRDLSNSANAEYGYEEYFLKAKDLSPGEFYVGPVVGYHVTKEEYEKGERFDGIMRFASPVFDSTGFAGVVELAMNFVHLMEFTDHILPTEPGMVFADVNPEDGNYCFMVDRNGFIISHPADYLIRGLGEDKEPAPVLDEENYEKYLKTGKAGMNVLNMGFKDENLPRIHSLASDGKSGSFTYSVDDRRIFAAYAHIPYYGSVFSKPEGFGWIGMIVDIDKYHNLSQEKVKEIQQKVERWQKSSIVVVFVSLFLLFIIALILARGLYRSIQSAQRQGGSKYPLENDEE